ncbi:MAG: 50S ribosomal protein L23 [Candidatus Pacebacteria bacterium]|nr:50S ribosomal protein L23 [Candidatus Paceibacterota bacterium]
MDKFLIKKPIITEKSVSEAKIGKYVFLVENNATKPEVKKALKVIYKVDTVKINIVNARPKTKRMGNYHYSKSGYKKAIVTLKKGQKLDILQS